jgi:hypothetical protein
MKGIPLAGHGGFASRPRIPPIGDGKGSRPTAGSLVCEVGMITLPIHYSLTILGWLALGLLSIVCERLSRLGRRISRGREVRGS